MTHEFPELRKYDPEPSNASVARTNERTPDPAAVPGQVRRTAGPAQQVPSGGVVSALELRPRETRVRGVSVSGLQETRQGARGAEEGSLELSGDVQRHLQNLQERTSAKKPDTVQPATEQEPSLKYGSSPLRRAITVSSQDSSDDASTESEPAHKYRPDGRLVALQPPHPNIHKHNASDTGFRAGGCSRGMYIACGRAAARLPRLLFARSADVAVSERTPHVHETGAARLGAERPAVAADSGRAAARVAWQGPAGGLAVPDDTAAHPGSSPGRHRRGVCAAAGKLGHLQGEPV
ncbi:hypothetical protein KL920_003852 [Ogataea angusta]|nr:hypothetical protein KL920_003852 [Ogataea angusta]